MKSRNEIEMKLKPTQIEMKSLANSASIYAHLLKKN